MKISYRTFFTCVFLVFLLPHPSFLWQVRNPDSRWSSGENLSNTSFESSSPSITADPSGNVHLAWIEVKNEKTNINYMKASDNLWNTPIDIFTSGGSYPITKVKLISDAGGYLHIFFTRQGSGIYYAKAYALDAHSAKAWSRPQQLVSATTFVGQFNAVVSGEQTISLVYAIQTGDNSGISTFVSSDGGENWKGPYPAYVNSSSKKMVDHPDIAVDSANVTHVVWIEYDYPETVPPVGVRYTSSPDHLSWEAPKPLADGPYDWPAVLATREDDIHVVWSGTTPDRYKFHTWSRDGGRSWFDVYRNIDLGGFQGSSGLLEDNQGRIYWLQIGDGFTLKIGDSLFENIFVNNVWGPTSFVFRPAEDVPQNMMNISAVIARGNQLHLVVMTPLPSVENEYQFDIFYFRKTLDTPETQAVALPTLTPVTVITSQAKPKPTLTQPPFNFSETNAEAPASLSLTHTLTLGVIPVIIFVVLVVVMKSYRRED